MKRLAMALALALALTACAAPPAGEGEDLKVLCTTYPVYLFTTAVTDGVEGVSAELLVNSQTSCLHDYTLTVKDMKAIESAGVIVLNGGGLEEFMAHALSGSKAAVIDCSEGLPLLPRPEDHGHGHGHDGDPDPHFWMDPHLAGQMVDNIAAGLTGLDPDHAGDYEANRVSARKELEQVDPSCRDAVYPPYPLITFHDGFQYFAASQGFELVKAIEEEEGSTASAAEIVELSQLVAARGIPAVFTEKNGPSATARAIARETGCRVWELDMLMSGDGRGIGAYTTAIQSNLITILTAFGKEGTP